MRFGRAPRRALVFRASTPFAKIIIKFAAPNGSKHKIEFLGDGQQIIVARHPPRYEDPLFVARRSKHPGR